MNYLDLKDDGSSGKLLLRIQALVGALAKDAGIQPLSRPWRVVAGWIIASMLVDEFARS